jgi:tetratricopeptide (TPR) repeat protein
MFVGAGWVKVAGADFGVFCEPVENELRGAEESIDKGLLDQAEEVLGRIRTQHPRCERVLLGLGRIAAARDQKTEALDKLTQYKTAKPTDPDGYYYLAQLSLDIADYRNADVMSELAVVFGPEHAKALSLRGKILGMKGQLGLAEEMLRRARDLDPEDPQAHFELGVFFDSRKRNAEAVEAFERTIQLDPGNPSAYDYLALNLEPMGEIERADEAYRQGLKVNNQSRFDQFLDYNYGRFLVKQHRLEEAKKHLDRAVELAPGTRAVHYEHGKLMLALGKPAAAVADLEKAINLPDPGNFVLDLQIYYLLSQAHARLGQSGLAKKYAELSRQAKVPLQGRARQ